MKREDVPTWCFLTGQFLFDFEHKKHNSSYLLVHRDFVNNTVETEPRLDDFSYINPGVIIMLCYGLLVYPVELWVAFLKDEMSMKALQQSMVTSAQRYGFSIKTLTELFKIEQSELGTEAYFIRKLRNAVAHSHIEFDENRYKFWNIKKGLVDFRVSISIENLGIFLTGLGRHFSNYHRTPAGSGLQPEP